MGFVVVYGLVSYVSETLLRMWSSACVAVEEASEFLKFVCELVSYDSEALLRMWSCVCVAVEEASEFLKFLKFLVHDDPVLYTTVR